jgi:hypothetical protein
LCRLYFKKRREILEITIREYKDGIRSCMSGYKGYIVNEKYTAEYDPLTGNWIVKEVGNGRNTFISPNKREALNFVRALLLQDEINKRKEEV